MWQQREKSVDEHGGASAHKRTGELGGRLPRRKLSPRLPEDEYKVVFRPRTGLNVSKWTSKVISESIAKDIRILIKEYYAHVTIQTQRNQNLVIASTALEERVDKLLNVTQIELENAAYELFP